MFPPLFDHRSEYPPLGMGYLASVLDEAGVQVDALDLSVLEPEEWEKNADRKIEKFKPDIVGVSALTNMYDSAMKLGEHIRKLHPDTKIAFGGPHPTIFPELVLKNNFVDFVVRGEGENTFLELVNSLSNGLEIEKIEGLSFKKNGKIVHNKDRGFIEDLDSIPLPDRDMFQLDKYAAYPQMNIITSRGCPYNCYFCFHGMFGHTFRARSPENVVDELEFMKNNYKASSFWICDDLFMFDRERAIKICNLIIERGLDIKWESFARINTVDMELLRIMKRAGCWGLNFGVETGDPEIMRKIRKGITLDQVRKVMKMIRVIGIEGKANFMIGHPWDTKETIERTIKFSKEVAADRIIFSITTPYPSTDLWKMAKNLGVVPEDDSKVNWRETLSFGDNVDPVMRTFTLSPREIKLYHEKATREWYIHNLLFMVMHPPKLWRVIRRKGLLYSVKTFLKLLSFKRYKEEKRSKGN